MQNKYNIQYFWGEEEKAVEDFFEEITFQQWYCKKVHDALCDCFGADYEIKKVTEITN